MPLSWSLSSYCSQFVSAVAGEILYEDKFTDLDPSWGSPGERLSVEDGKLTLKPSPDTTQSILNQANVFTDADISVDSHPADRRRKRTRRLNFLGKGSSGISTVSALTQPVISRLAAM